jgi:hypothetical protein
LARGVLGLKSVSCAKIPICGENFGRSGEQAELNPGPEKNKGRGRPKGALTEAAENIGIK